jgi:hypothetical protein
MMNTSIVVLLTCRCKAAEGASPVNRADWTTMYTRPGTRHPRRPKAPTAPVPDWAKLARGDLVQIAGRDGTRLSGVIDMIALDRSVFWIVQEGGQGRILVCNAAKPQVTVLRSTTEVA